MVASIAFTSFVTGEFVGSTTEAFPLSFWTRVRVSDAPDGRDSAAAPTPAAPPSTPNFDTSPKRGSGGVAVSPYRVRAWHKHVSFAGMAVGWLLIAYLVTWPNDMHVLRAGIGVLFFGTLMFIGLAYTGTMRREYALAMFKSKGWLYTFLSGRLFRGCAWLLFAMIMALVLFLQMHAYSAVEWGALSLGLVVFPATLAWFRRPARAEVREDMADSMALLLTLRTCPAVMAVLYVLAITLFGDLPRHESLGAAINENQTAPAQWSGSELIGEGLYWSAHLDGLKAYAVSHVGELGALPALALLLLASYAVFFGACLALTPLLVSPREFRRARMVPRWGMAAPAFAAVAIAGAYGLDSLDRWFRDSPVLRDVRVTVERVSVEIIDGRVYRAGSRADILVRGREATQRFESEVDVLRDRLDAMFKTLESDAVAEYLDWYYSPTGAVLRLFDSVEYVYAALTGDSNMEEVDNQMAEHLQEVFGRQFPDVNAAHAAILVAWERESLQLGRDAREILAENRLVPVPHDYEVVWEGSLDDNFASALPEGSIPPGALGVTAAAGVLSTMFARTFVARALRKPAFKVAGKSLTRAVTTATRGFMGGVVAFLGVEALSVKLEEMLERDEFERQLVDAMREARLEFEQDYFGLADEAPLLEAAP